jgi:DNA-binding CsgD family transcriptional regulator
VLELIARAHTVTECARLLGISPGTLRSHIRDLMDRLQLTGIEGLRKFAQDHLGALALD